MEIYKALIKMGLMITVNTNASLITPEILDCFKTYRPEKVNVTLYGMSDGTYHNLCGNSRGFDAAVRGILAMKETGIRVNLNTTFTKYNVADMEKIVDFVKTHHIPVRMAAYVFPPIRNQRDAEAIYLTPTEMGQTAARFDLLTLDPTQLEGRRVFMQKCLDNQPALDFKEESRISSCMAGRGAFWISWDGKMYPCGMLSDFEVDARSVDFHTAWEKTCQWVPTMQLPMECLGCKYQKLCPSCAAVSMSVCGRTDALVQDMCTRTEAYVQAFLNDGSQTSPQDD